MVTEQQTKFGLKYVVDGVISSPTGRAVEVRTIWISDGPDDPPRLVTAYPAEEARRYMYREHDMVVLRRDLVDHGLVKDDLGAVVGVYSSGGYEVEFTAAGGATVAVVTLAEDDIRPRRRREILHVREVAEAVG